MERVLTAGVPVWGALLAARRERSNAVLAAARASGAPAAGLRAALLDVGPLVEQVVAVGDDDPSDVDVPGPLRGGDPGAAELVDAVVDVVSGLVLARRWAAGTAERDAVLGSGPALVAWLARAPRAVLDVLVHGAHHTARSADPDAWARRLVAGADALTGALPTLDDPAATLRDVGAVAAWRSGLVRLRPSALDAARRLPEAAALAALDLDARYAPDGLAAVLDRHAAEPWWWPTWTARPGQVHVRARVGGFRGTDSGPWVRLPRVVGSAGDGWRWTVETDAVGAARGGAGARDAGGGATAGGPAVGGVERWVVACDVHGTAIARDPGPAGEPAAVTAEVLTVSGTSVRLAGATGTLPWDDAVTGSAAARGVALVSRASSYALDVLVAER